MAKGVQAAAAALGSGAGGGAGSCARRAAVFATWCASEGGRRLASVGRATEPARCSSPGVACSCGAGGVVMGFVLKPT